MCTLNNESPEMALLYNKFRQTLEEREVIPTAGSLPSYAELKKSADRFYELFSDAVYKYNVICDNLQTLQHTQALIIKVMNEMGNIDFQFSTKSQWNMNFMGIKAENAALISSYETAKASAEAIVKYLNSAQFTITSGRFSETHAGY